MITCAILVAYALLILATILVDPKQKRAVARKQRTIYFTLALSTVKMSIAIAVVIAVVLIARRPWAAFPALAGLKLDWRAAAAGLIAALGFVVLYISWHMVRERITTQPGGNNRSEGLIASLPSRLPALIMVFGLISVEAGVLEEVFFRGIMQTHFASHIGSAGAVLAAGLLFGLAHFYQGFGGIIGTSMLGIWLGLTYALTGNILVPVTGHVLGDFVCMLLQCPAILRQKKADA